MVVVVVNDECLRGGRGGGVDEAKLIRRDSRESKRVGCCVVGGRVSCELLCSGAESGGSEFGDRSRQETPSPRKSRAEP